MRLWMLGSGSHGNALLIECAGSRILIDGGFPPRELKRRLGAVGAEPESIDAVVVTHEHHDHARGVAAAARRWKWTVFASEGTAADRSLRRCDVRTFAAGATIALPTMDVQTIAVSHDAAEPIALVATARASGVRLGVAYDLGAASVALLRAFAHLDMLVVEANHDDTMLREGPYPIFVQRRIAGRCGHLSNGASAALARDCVHRGLQEVVLAHISEQCNTPALAVSAVGRALGMTRFGGRVSAAMQDGVVGPFTARASRAPASSQLTLAL